MYAFFSTEMTPLEFAMHFSNRQSTGQTSLPQEALPALLKVYQVALKHSLSKHQLVSLLNVNGSGWVSREELLDVVHQLDSSISLDETRALLAAVDKERLGSIPVAGVAAAIYQASGVQFGVSEFLVSTIIAKVCQQLAKEHPEDFEVEFRKLRAALIAREQLTEASDGLVQKITIAASDFFSLVVFANFREEEKVQLAKAFGIASSEQLDLERVIEALEQAKREFQLHLQLSNAREAQGPQEADSEEVPMQRSVVLKELSEAQPQSQSAGHASAAAVNNISLLQTSILQHICAVLNQH